MPKFYVTETVIYEVEADDAEHAEDIITQAENTGDYFVCVDDRKVEEIEP